VCCNPECLRSSGGATASGCTRDRRQFWNNDHRHHDDLCDQHHASPQQRAVTVLPRGDPDSIALSAISATGFTMGSDECDDFDNRPDICAKRGVSGAFNTARTNGFGLSCSSGNGENSGAGNSGTGTSGSGNSGSGTREQASGNDLPRPTELVRSAAQGASAPFNLVTAESEPAADDLGRVAGALAAEHAPGPGLTLAPDLRGNRHLNPPGSARPQSSDATSSAAATTTSISRSRS